jgi:hypothetical protein
MCDGGGESGVTKRVELVELLLGLVGNPFNRGATGASGDGDDVARRVDQNVQRRFRILNAIATLRFGACQINRKFELAAADHGTDAFWLVALHGRRYRNKPPMRSQSFPDVIDYR